VWSAVETHTSKEEPAMTEAAAGATAVEYAVVIPTLGRPSLSVALRALADAEGPAPRRIVLVDDRPL
jgi:hypothetical protein